MIEFYGHMKEVFENLDERFIKSHRSYIVNTKHIVEVRFPLSEIQMDNGDICLLSKRGAKFYKEVLSGD